MRTKLKLLPFLLAIIVSITSIDVAQAQTLEEIVVTAQKRAESAQDVPIAITAFDAAELDRNQIIYVLDLVSVQFHRIEGSNRDRDVLCAFGAFLCRNDDFIERLCIHEID